MGRRGWSGSYLNVRSLLRAIILLVLLHSPVTAQNNVGIGTTAPDPSALLDLTSSDKGFLVPRLSTTEMNSVASPATGLLIYNTTQSGFYYYNGSTWLPFLAAANAWQTTGNAGTAAETNYLGTSDANPLVIKTDGVQRMIILKTGEVGIDVATPNSKLAVNDGNISIVNTLNSAGQLRYYEPSASGTNYTGFTAGVMGSDIIYTLPTTAPTAGQVLTAGATPTTLQWSSVAGGAADTLWFVGAGTSSLVGRGNNNTGAGNYSIAAGQNNSASGLNSVTIGGYGSVSNGNYSAIGGGYINQTSGTYATISGGQNNVASATNASVGGGNANTASGQYSVADGGQSNIARGNYSSIGGGVGNNATANAVHGTISGGQSNTADAQWTSVTGGLNNAANGNYSTVVGGQLNSANATHGLVGGYNNSIGSSANYSFVFGAGTSITQANTVVFNHAGTAFAAHGPTKVGIRNLAPTEALDVSGNVRFSGALMPNNLPGTAGQLLVSAGANTAPTWSSGSGLFWTLSGNGSTSPSTNFLGTTDSVDMVFRTNNSERIRLMANGYLGIGTSNPGVKLEVSNGTVSLTNTNNTATGVRLYEPSSSGTNYTEFKARAMSANLAYTMPDTAGRQFDVLTNDGNGNLYWTNNLITGSLYLGSTTTSTLSADANDLPLDANYTLHRMSANGNGVDITGLANGVDGRVVILVNVGSYVMTLLYEDVNSVAANRIIGSGGNFSFGVNKAVSLVYDGVSSRWRIYAAYP